MSLKQDTAKTVVIVDGKQAISELGKLELKANELRNDLKGMKKGSDDYIESTKKLKTVRQDIEAHRKQLGLAGMTLGQLTRYQRELRNEIRNTATQGTARYKELEQQYRQVTKEVNKQNAALRGTTGIFSGLKREVKQFGALAIAYLGFDAVFTQIENLISGSARLSDQIADVQKTTELTDGQIKDLMQTFKTFNTRTPRKELMALAVEAGKMGIRGVQNIAAYVEQTNELTTALGDDLGEDAGLKVAKMAERFDVSMRQIGSGINAVSDNTKAKAGFITEFLSRLAGSGNEVGIAAGDILGYGASIDEMGLNVEMASTALNNFFIEFVKNTEKYGEAAGFANGELSKLIGEKGTNEGFLSFLQRLKETNPEADKFLQKLEDIGIDGARGSQVFLALSQNVDQLRDRQALANREIEKGTSLTEEYNRKNENLGASLARLQKWIAGKFINSTFLDWLGGIVGKLDEWTQVPLSETMEEQRIKMNALATQAFGLNEESDEYRSIIGQLKAQYPEYLGQLDADKTKHEDLVKALKAANDQLIQKIAIQQLDEEMIAAGTKAAERKITADKARIKLSKEIAERAAKLGIEEHLYGKSLEEQVKIIDRKNIAQTNSQMSLDTYASKLLQVTALEVLAKEAAEDSAEAQEILNEIRAQFQVNDSPDRSNGNEKSVVPSKSVLSAIPADSEVKASFSKALAAFDTGHDLLIQKLREAYLEQKLTKEEFELEMQMLDLATLEAKRALAAETGYNTITFDKQINELRFKLASEAHEQKLAADEAALQAIIDNEEAKQKAYDATTESILENAEKQREANEKLAEAERQRAEAAVIASGIQVAAAVDSANSLEDAGVAIINSIREIIKGYMQQAVAAAVAKEVASKGLLGLITGAVAVGAVTALFNTFFPPVKTKAQKQRASDGARPRGFYHGGDTGTTTTGERDPWGSVSMSGPGFNLHGNEIVVPNYERADPMALNMEAYFAAKNPNFKSNINPATVPPIGMTPEQAERLISKMDEMIATAKATEKMKKSYVVLSEFEAKQLELANAKGKGL